jgi:tetratricopeptide (TPR) repeat protein
VTFRRTRLAAAALAAAAFAPGPAAADALADAENGVLAAERRLSDVERLGRGVEETPAARAARKFGVGEAQYLLGDWMHAAVLLSDAVDEPAFREARQRPEALFLLADALRRQGACGAARPRYAELLTLGAGARRGDAVLGALDCAVQDRRSGDVEALLAEAEKTWGGEAPTEVRYLAAKALFQRTDLPPRERIERAAAAFARVGKPFQLQAAYFQGVLAIQQGNLHGSLQWFESCARTEPAPGQAGATPPAHGAERPESSRQAEVRELCMLALGRVHADMGNVSASLDWYAAVPWESPRFVEALYELAWAFVKDQKYDAALRTAAFIGELAPDSPLAPEATVLEGHLLLRLGRYAEATDAYNHVINTYAPVRDELDAILAMREDPVRYFNELVGRQGKAFDVATVLPPIAVKWASTKREVDVAIDLVASLDRARREVQASREVAARVEALLAHGGGLDAFPALRRAYATAEAVENDAAVLEGSAVAAASSAAERALPPERRGEISRARAARQALEPRMRAMPRTQDAVDERLARMRSRIDRVDRSAYQVGYLVDSIAASVTGTEQWVEQHRSEIESDPEGRQALAEELRQHRDMVSVYEEELRGLRQQIALVRDAAAGAEAMGEEARVRKEYLAAVEVERAAAEAARGTLAGPDRDALARADAVRERLAALRTRAEAARLGFAADASRRAGELRDRVAAEQVALASHAGSLDGVQAVAKDLVGRIAYRSFLEVRAQFYKLVLKADVGIVDVAWSRKRQRLDKIQQLSQQKANEIEQLDREYRALAREVD